MPQMGESVTEGTISKWLVKEGDVVKRDQPILEISTDKVDSEVPAPADGRIKKIIFKEGEVVPVKTVIAVIDTDVTQQAIYQNDGENLSREKDSMSKITPVVRQIAQEAGLTDHELQEIKGSGAGGRVTKADIQNYIRSRSLDKVNQTSSAQTSDNSSQQAPKYQISKLSFSSGLEISPELAKQLIDNEHTITPMDIMRRSIAEHMVRSKATSPHVYSIIEVDCTRISRFRNSIKEDFQRIEGYSLSFTPFFLEAAIKGILEFPILNTSVDGTNIIYKKHIHLGVAVALGNTGLIVPVIKRAEEKSFLGICRALNDLANRARNKKLTPDEVAGGTFTVTNPGVFGTLIGTPIINQPQVAILCLGAITKRPAVVDDDKIAIRDLCYLTLSYDHRVIDGSVSGQFLSFVKKYIENWDLNRNIFI